MEALIVLVCVIENVDFFHLLNQCWCWLAQVSVDDTHYIWKLFLASWHAVEKNAFFWVCASFNLLVVSALSRSSWCPHFFSISVIVSFSTCWLILGTKILGNRNLRSHILNNNDEGKFQLDTLTHHKMSVRVLSLLLSFCEAFKL